MCPQDKTEAGLPESQEWIRQQMSATKALVYMEEGHSFPSEAGFQQHSAASRLLSPPLPRPPVCPGLARFLLLLSPQRAAWSLKEGPVLSRFRNLVEFSHLTLTTLLHPFARGLPFPLTGLPSGKALLLVIHT